MPEPADIYAAVQLLEDEGFVMAETTAGRRSMVLTEAGRVEAVRRRESSAGEPWLPPAPEPIDQRELVHSISEAAALLVQAVRIADDEQRAEIGALITGLRDDLAQVVPVEEKVRAGRSRTWGEGPQIPTALADFLFGENGVASRANEWLQRVSDSWPDFSATDAQPGGDSGGDSDGESDGTTTV